MKSIILIIPFLSAAVLAGGCRTSAYIAERSNSTVKTDTIITSTRTSDTLWIRDSVVKTIGADSTVVMTERERVVYRSRTLHDTVYVARADSVRRETAITTAQNTSAGNRSLRYYTYNMCVGWSCGRMGRGIEDFPKEVVIVKFCHPAK